MLDVLPRVDAPKCLLLSSTYICSSGTVLQQSNLSGFSCTIKNILSRIPEQSSLRQCCSSIAKLANAPTKLLHCCISARDFTSVIFLSRCSIAVNPAFTILMICLFYSGQANTDAYIINFPMQVPTRTSSQLSFSPIFYSLVKRIWDYGRTIRRMADFLD